MLGVGTEEIRAEVKALNTCVLSNTSGQMVVEEKRFYSMRSLCIADKIDEIILGII